MKILHLHPGPDTGGQSMGGKPILEAAGHEVRVFVRTQHRFDYARAERWMTPADVEESFTWADVVVVHNEPRTFEMVARGRPKPLIVHHHGSRFRRDAFVLYRKAADLGAVQVVSTVDLLLEAPSGGQLFWQPQNIDLPKMAAIRAAHYAPDGRIRVAHAPTNRQIKGTGMVQHAIRTSGGALNIVLIEHKNWAKCLRLKATADMYADQFALGYGNNAIEAWGMGMPVIAGADGRILRRMRAEYGELPFLTSDRSNLQRHLLDLAESPDLRAEWAERGMAHVRRFHAPEPWLARFEEIAALAIERATVAA